MKICIVSNYKANGYGESTRPYFLSINLLKQGHKILHLCQHEGSENGIKYVNVDTWKWEHSPVIRIFNFFRLFLRVRLFAPDVIYMHQFNNARWALATRIMPRAKFVFDAHTSVYFETQTFSPQNTAANERIRNEEESICKKADYIICASDETRLLLKSSYCLNDAKLFVVGNSTNIAPVTEEEKVIKKEGGFFTGLATLPFDGFISNELALAYLFEIAALVQSKTDRIKFVILGGGEKPVPPIANVIYAGYVPDLRKEILAADICLMPYPDRAVCGGARNKFCDFVALGKVVISSPEGLRGMQILEPGKNCILANNKEEYAQRIIELYENGEELKQLENGVFKIRSYYNWKDRAAEVADIFKKILSS